MNFSLNWFKSKKIEEQKEEEQKEEELIKDKTVPEIEKNPYDELVEEIITEKPYLNLILVNNSLTVILRSGEILSKGCVNKELYEKVKNSRNEEELMNLMIPEERAKEKQKEEEERLEKLKESEKLQKIVKNFDLLVESGEFELKDNAVYFKGINRSLPELLAYKFIEILEKYTPIDRNIENWGKSLNNDVEFTSLKRFWFWCCLNPSVSVCNWLYDFLTKGDFKITKDGMFLAYRRVCKVDTEINHSYVDFISNSYVKVKTVWKKSPKTTSIWLDSDGNYLLNSKKEDKYIGTLEELYLNLDKSEENRYTDNYTKSIDIRIGAPIVMPRSDCNFTTVDCGVGGYHFANNNFDYYSFGDTGILMLVNPYNVVGIGSHKGRCCEYLPLCTLSLDEERTILADADFDTTELEEYYAQEQLKDLEERVKHDYITELGKNEFNLPSIEIKEIKTIISSLEDIKKELKDRIVEV